MLIWNLNFHYSPKAGKGRSLQLNMGHAECVTESKKTCSQIWDEIHKVIHNYKNYMGDGLALMKCQVRYEIFLKDNYEDRQDTSA